MNISIDPKTMASRLRTGLAAGGIEISDARTSTSSPFTVDWEHRFGDGLPRYRQVSREGCVLPLSEHHRDATPGGAIRVEIADVRRPQRDLVDSPVNPLRIGLDSQPWGRI